MNFAGKEYLAYSANVKVGKSRWVSNWRFNGLYKITDGKADFIGQFVSAKDISMGIHALAKEKNGRIYFFPQKSCFIDIYDMEKECFGCIEIYEWKNYKNKCVVFAFDDGSGFWIVPRYGELPIVKIDYEGKTQRIISLDYCSNSENFCLSACVDEDNNIYISCFNKNDLIKINANTGKYTIYSYEKRYAFESIEYWNDLIYISDRSNIRVLDKNMLIKKTYDEVIQNNRYISSEIAKIKVYEDSLWIVPVWMKKIIKLSLIDGTKREIMLEQDLSLEVNDDIRTWRLFKEAEVMDDQLVVYPMALKSEIVVNKDNDINYNSYIVNTDSIPRLVKSNGLIYKEIDHHNLEGFINMI